MTAGKTVSVIVTNFNYASFLSAAIQSALDQTYPVTEIIVVDDGSTDNSREIIERFGTRITTIFKGNGGQRSACNIGFAASTGDIVLFLDGDDAWRSDAVENIVAAMQPKVAAVQFCVAILDQNGRRLGGIYPPLPENWTPSRIRDCVLKSGFYPCPPTSGNAYARWFLDRIMPIPVGEVRDAMDGPLNTVAPLYGDVVVLTEPLGFYRIHGTNVGALTSMVSEKFSYFVDLDRERGDFLIDHARRLGMPFDARVLDRAFFYLQYRLASRKLRPDLHPLTQDRVPSLVVMLIRSAILAPERPLLRAFVVIWGVAVALAPRRLADRLVAMRFISSARPAFVDAALAMLRLVRRTTKQDHALPTAAPHRLDPALAPARIRRNLPAAAGRR
jgi:glycosyltransferase involved in cell wall biosynthesis